MALLRKELRALVPFIALVLFVCAFNVADEFVGHQPDMRPLSRTSEAYVALDEEFSIPLFLLVFTLGLGLLVREHDEGTIEFLDSLPVSRSRVFWTKVALASLVLWLVPLTNVGLAATLHGWSRTSLEPSFQWQALLMSFFLYACQTTVFLSLALALSFFRRFGWLVLALLIWGYVLVRGFFPAVAALNIFELATPQFEGQRWLLPADLLKVQIPMAAVLIAVAYFLFTGTGDRLIHTYNKLARARAGGGVLIATGTIAAILLVAAFGYFSVRGDEDPEDSGEPRAVYATWTAGRAQSRFFSFVYPSNLADRARATIERADEVHEAVRQFLEADPGGTQIVVDMTGTSPRHLGTAYWNTIRMDLSASDEPDLLLSVLGHETTHVYVDRLSDSRLTDTYNSTRFFHEGLATYLEHRLFGSAATIAPHRSVAAVMRERREVVFEELVDDTLLRRTRDGNLVYPLGEVFVAALVDRYGDGAPGRLLRAFARKDQPKQLQLMELWQDAFQAAGFTLEETIDAFFVRLDALVTEHRAFIKSLPRPRAAIRSDDEWIGIEPVWTPVEDWIAVCRFRQFPDADDRDYLEPEMEDDGVFWIGRDSLPAATFWFQIGLRETAGERVIWEPWQEARLGR